MKFFSAIAAITLMATPAQANIEAKAPNLLMEKLYYAEGRVTKIKENLFSYSVITAKGLSGAPVWVEKGRKRIIVGVHVGSDFGDEKGAVARIVDSTFIHDWNRWKGRRETAN